ncbi:GspE/PulE family protein [Allohahella marinimesophila]|uniref:GspE/PulE family protein n=1 Tax=Allohahella marinimesophila TaxID=1054972 RepID=A0ABP7PTC2_9GAMM
MTAFRFPAAPLDDRSLVMALVDDGVLAQDVAERYLTQPKASRTARTHSSTGATALPHPLESLAQAELTDLKSQRVLTLDRLTAWLAERAGLPLFHIDPLKINAGDVSEVMSFPFAQRHSILAVEVSDSEVTIATHEPFVESWKDNLRHVLRKDIRVVVASPADIKRFTIEFYKLASSVQAFSRTRNKTGAAVSTGNLEQLLEVGSLASADANDQHIVSIVDWLLQYAFEQRASDIHIEPRRKLGHVRFRIDGVLHPVYEMPIQVNVAVVSRLKILGRLNVAEKRKPQDGRIKTKNPGGKEIELRLSTLPTAFGEKLVMRIFDPDVLLRSFSELGLSQDELQRWRQMIAQPNGIILVTGPTGSGKTTTLYSSLKSLATEEVNVCTIEDPIEMVEPAFNQIQVQAQVDLDFATGVKALLRQDPDIIMIGEIRDLETAEMAIQAALTGHLVLSTLHTNDAPGTITRLLELGIAPYLVKATVLGVMAQRLVRTLCPECKRPATLDPADWKALVSPWKADMPTKTFEAEGCLECRFTGFRGRAGVYELMLMSEGVRNHIKDHTDIDALRLQAMREGMKTLRLSGANKIAQGLTTPGEVLRVTPSTGVC